MKSESIFHGGNGVLLSLILLNGCVTTSPNPQPKYQPPPPGAAASVIDSGKHSHVWSIDGAEAPAFSRTLRLMPGEHRVGINCLSVETSVGLAVTGVARVPLVPVSKSTNSLQFVQVTGAFESGKTYYARCVAVDGKPTAWLADTPTGSELPHGFTSICTRGCLP